MPVGFNEILAQIEQCKCKTCHGSGECDDAEAGDIRFNTFLCTACKGTGWKDGKEHSLIEIKDDALNAST
jgi:hypothetical protein